MTATQQMLAAFATVICMVRPRLCSSFPSLGKSQLACSQSTSNVVCPNFNRFAVEA